MLSIFCLKKHNFFCNPRWNLGKYLVSTQFNTKYLLTQGKPNTFYKYIIILKVDDQKYFVFKLFYFKKNDASPTTLNSYHLLLQGQTNIRRSCKGFGSEDSLGNQSPLYLKPISKQANFQLTTFEKTIIILCSCCRCKGDIRFDLHGWFK